jgi:hypothetical protein
MVCGQSNQLGAEAPVALVGSFALPNYADAATVLLNGWRFRYLSSDHHVRSLGARIEHVAVGPGAISWVARGSLRDRNFDDEYQFCYVYTVIGWNSGMLDAIANNGTNIVVAHNEDTTTALIALSAAVQLEAPAADRRTLTLLPRGFDSEYRGYNYFGDVDHPRSPARLSHGPR